MELQKLTKWLCEKWVNRIVVINRSLSVLIPEISPEVWIIFPCNGDQVKYKLTKVTRSEVTSYELLCEYDCEKHVFADALLTEYTL